MKKKTLAALIQASLAAAIAGTPAVTQAADAPATVGKAPQESPANEVAALFDERGVLTPAGTFVLEPSLQYVHNTSTDVAIQGFTVIPAIAIGLINISELQRDTLTAALTARYGITNRFEIEAKVPYVYRSEDVKEREVLEGTSTNVINDSDGNGLGDIEFALHYQINQGRNGWPFFVANVRVKSRTGKDPYEVDRRTLLDEDGNEIGEVFDEQPTGSGFWGVQPSLTVIYPADPAVLFANVSYLWNVERNVSGLGDVDPGDALGFSFGMGFAINEATSFSLGYDHSIVFDTDIENDVGIDPEFDSIQVGTFQLGLSHRLNPRSSINLSLGIGVTDAAPDVQMTLRVPYSF